MLKCNIASEAACGKECCCYDCLDAKKCENKCPTYEELGKKVLKECEEANWIEEQTEIATLDKQCPEVIKAITDLTLQKKAIEAQEAAMRVQLLQAMEEHGIKSFENDYIKLTYIAATQRKSIDSAKLKKEHPEIAEAYQKVSAVKASVKIEVK